MLIAVPLLCAAFLGRIVPPESSHHMIPVTNERGSSHRTTTWATSMRKNQIKTGCTHKMAALTNIQETDEAERRLHGRFLDSRGFDAPEKVTQSQQFAGAAIAVNEPLLGIKTRQYDIRIVLGPSGSGKTLFSINHLGAFLDGVSGKAIPGSWVCVYCSLADTKWKEKSVAKDVRDILTNALKIGSHYEWKRESTERLNMKLALVLDEVDMYDWLGNKDAWEAIYGEVLECAKYARVILSGTGFDKTPATLSSSSDIYKYRMKPWERSSFEAAVAKHQDYQTQDGKERAMALVNAIYDDPVLWSLTSNARAAMFTFDAVSDLSKGYYSINLKGTSGAIAQGVLGRYLSFNGIGKLSEQERKDLACAVFHEINIDNETEEAKFPEFKKLKGKIKVKRQALSVLDIHVESSGCNGKDGKESWIYLGDYEDCKHSISITPAMSMLLYTLLGVWATLYNDWEGLKTVTALHAAYLEVLENEETQEKGLRIARLTKPVPAPAATKNLSIPLPDNDIPTIFINGDKASFCDVFTKNRVFQSKHTKTKDAAQVAFHLGEELQKCGLLKTSLGVPIVGDSTTEEGAAKKGKAALRRTTRNQAKYKENFDVKKKTVDKEEKKKKKTTKKKREYYKAFRMGRATMTALMDTWTNEATLEDMTKEVVMPGSVAMPFQSRTFCLPRSYKAKEEVVPTRAYEVESNDVGKIVVLREGEAISELSFSEDSPLKMTFVTNAKEMKLLPCNKEGNTVVLGFDSVNVDGSIKDKDTMNEILKGIDILDGVELRFVFLGN